MDPAKLSKRNQRGTPPKLLLSGVCQPRLNCKRLVWGPCNGLFSLAVGYQGCTFTLFYSLFFFLLYGFPHLTGIIAMATCYPRLLKPSRLTTPTTFHWSARPEPSLVLSFASKKSCYCQGRTCLFSLETIEKSRRRKKEARGKKVELSLPPLHQKWFSLACHPLLSLSFPRHFVSLFLSPQLLPRTVAAASRSKQASRETKHSRSIGPLYLLPAPSERTWCAVI